MALPASRNTTYAEGSQVKSYDLDDIQDKIIALNTSVNGSRIIPFGPNDMVPAVAAEWEWDFTNGIPMRKRANSNAGADSFLYVPLPPMRTGDRLVDFTLYVYEFNSLTANRTYAKWARDTLAAFNEVDAGTYTISTGASAAPASATVITVAAANQTLAQVYHRLQLIIRCKTVGCLFSGGHAVIDHP